MNRLFLLTFIVAFPLLSHSQIFNGTGGAIPDNGNLVSFSIPVSGQPYLYLDSLFGIQSICLNITHTYDSDLKISLISPDGSRILLANGNGGSGHNFTNTCFDDISTTSIIQGVAPFTGNFLPVDDLGLLNNGGPVNGNWTLEILDTYAFADEGTLLDWNITFGNQPALAFHLLSSNLPIIIIETNGNEIVDDPKVQASFKVYNNNSGLRNYLSDTPEYEGFCGIELRGSSSQSFPKKSYGLETWDTNGETVNASILGFPEEEDWVLIANYTDKTLMRNFLSYKLFNEMGHYASRMKFVEIIVNKDYKGVYLFGEKIKRDGDRIAIEKLEPTMNSGDELTGGYIIKIDKFTGSGGDGWTSAFPPMANPDGQVINYLYEYPKSDEITEQQKAYISAYVDSFETALNATTFQDSMVGWRNFANEESFIDFFILNEISKNVDGYRLSTFLHKERDSEGGKLRIGPPWDFDLAWKNADYCDGWNPTGWAWQFSSVCSGDYWQIPFWWGKFMQDSLFVKHLKCRWEELRAGILETAELHQQIDSLAFMIAENQQRNFVRWPILGIYVWPNPSPLPQDYAGEIAQIKDWVTLRFAWLDYNLPGICPELPNLIEYPKNHELKIYPNPVLSTLSVTYSGNSQNLHVNVIDLYGRVLVSNDYFKQNSFQINFSSLSSGMYIISVQEENGKILYQPVFKEENKL